MKKILTMFFLLMFFWPSIAHGGTHIYDMAELLGSETADHLDEVIQKLEEQYQMDIFFVTTNDTQSLTSQEYADQFYDNLSQNDGFLFLIDMQNRAVTFSACGNAMAYFTDQEADHILDLALPYLSEGNYITAAESLIVGAGDKLARGISNNQYFYDEETGKIIKRPPDYGKIALISFGIGFVCASGVTLLVRKRYQAEAHTVQYDFIANSVVNLTKKQSNLINQHVRRQHITPAAVTRPSQRANSSGRTTIHRSASGRVHSGRSRRF